MLSVSILYSLILYSHDIATDLTNIYKNIYKYKTDFKIKVTYPRFKRDYTALILFHEWQKEELTWEGMQWGLSHALITTAFQN